ncbi:Deoxyribodipyrimidine photo-lyase [Magnetospirillum sp. LM-5]|uniref:cryptochrome/photolyase family protein n=1 Tax=Magnetospirillum sp. LM-5 TaxID=2681466 RepID=UPI00138530D7|nr:deoxyribodipyrimidine photo-lyase [Magnetospirillum sp. LM-5]CAA7617685.1 Deoxyribodipyrimidine photo-lyase [Magnetospirillum sp. LM-5]
MSERPVLVWLRRDLRLADQPAFHAAAARGPVIAVAIDDPSAPWSPGGASQWWHHHALADLRRNLGGALVVRRGDTVLQLARLAAECGAKAVCWTRHPEPHEQAAEAALAAALDGSGTEAVACPGDMLFALGAVTGTQGQPLKVFTAFWRAALRLPAPPAPQPAPALRHPSSLPPGDDLPPLPRPCWWDGLDRTWQPGEAQAQARLDRFLAAGLDGYASLRDRPDRDGTSGLSPHLAFGEISPRQMWHAIQARPASPGAETLLKQLGWREFSRHLLARHPDLPDRPLDRRFARFPWRDSAADFAAWSMGRTCIPIVDAGMRQLWTTGWMHNRVRMIVASVLVKSLMIPWQQGQAWFWDTLVDADLANNAASWQWVAGSGADAAPYFRIFNPILQGEKFDPAGDYVRTWVPELADLPAKLIHRPWLAGRPAPIVDLAAARERALAAYRGL